MESCCACGQLSALKAALLTRLCVESHLGQVLDGPFRQAGQVLLGVG
jgi:hypothetical protein